LTTKKEQSTPALTRKQQQFLDGYALHGTLLGAQRLTKIMKVNHYRWIKQPAYQQAFAAAEEAYVDQCKAELHRRAYLGINEPVVYQGALQYEPKRDASGAVKRDKKGMPVLSDRPLTIKRYSDVLLMFHLKAKRPHEFRDNSTVAVTNADGGPLSIEVTFVKGDQP
jgi:hypothetical protein